MVILAELIRPDGPALRTLWQALDQVVRSVAALDPVQGDIRSGLLAWRYLTPIEQRVATLTAAGSSNRVIASLLAMREKAVENHLTRIYASVGVRNRCELIAWMWGGLRLGPWEATA